MPAVAQRNIAFNNQAPSPGNLVAEGVEFGRAQPNPMGAAPDAPKPSVDYDKAALWSYQALHLCVDECETEAQLDRFIRESQCREIFQIQDDLPPETVPLNLKKEHIMRAFIKVWAGVQDQYHEKINQCPNLTQLKQIVEGIKERSKSPKAPFFNSKRLCSLTTAKANAEGMQQHEVLEILKHQILNQIDDILALPSLRTYMFGDRALEEHMLRSIGTAVEFDDLLPWVDELKTHARFSLMKGRATFEAFPMDSAKELAKLEIRRILA